LPLYAPLTSPNDNRFFQNSSTLSSLKILAHVKCVATLPCEIHVIVFASGPVLVSEKAVCELFTAPDANNFVFIFIFSKFYIYGVH